MSRSGRSKDAGAEGGLQLRLLTLGPRARNLEIARLTMRGLTRSRRSGGRLSGTRRPMAPIRSMTVPAMTLAAWVSRSRAAFRAMVKLPRSGSVRPAASVASVIAMRRTW